MTHCTNTLSMARYFSPALRRRIAPLILLVGGLLLFRTVDSEMPRDQELRFVLEPTQQNARAVRIAYLAAGEQVAAVEFRELPADARPLVHTPSLKPGPYDMAIEIVHENGAVQTLSQHFEVPSDPLRISLGKPNEP